MGRPFLGIGLAATLAATAGCRMCDDCQDYAPPVVNSVPAGAEYYETVGEPRVYSESATIESIEPSPTEATPSSDQGSSTR